MNAYTWGLTKTKKRIQTRDIPDAVKALVDNRQGGRHCVHCRAMKIQTPPDQALALELDHKQPLFAGGSHHHLNLQWLCQSHNRGRRGKATELRTPAWFYKRIRS